jgi:hypothetical protein
MVRFWMGERDVHFTLIKLEKEILEEEGNH